MTGTLRTTFAMSACAAALVFAMVEGCAASGANEDDGTGSCSVGSERCQCTKGGACDPGLECLSGICVDPTPTGGSGGTGGAGTGASGPTSTGTGAGMPCQEGCAAVDVLFALDSSGSMATKNQALSAQGAFDQVVGTLATMNCGTIDYRIGLTNDNDRGWTVPSGWTAPQPWFDSSEMDDNAIVTAFGQATQILIADGDPFTGSMPTAAGLEHVLTTSVSLLAGDSTGFLRPEALLVLVLVTDVDDYGWYDQLGANNCGAGWTGTPTPIQTLVDSLITLKGGDSAAVTAIVVSGDPAQNAGQNVCGQPLSCSGDIYQSDRLWQFADLLTQSGGTGILADLCDGPSTVPTTVQNAFDNEIDLACQQFEPPK